MRQERRKRHEQARFSDAVVCTRNAVTSLIRKRSLVRVQAGSLSKSSLLQVKQSGLLSKTMALSCTGHIFKTT